MKTDDPLFGPIDSGEPWFGGDGETNGESLPNGFRELNSEERNPISRPEPYKRCGAKKRNGEPCKGAAMANGRCRLHGGLTPSGLASPHYKHGRRSKLYRSLPRTIRQALDSEGDEQLVSIKRELQIQIGLLDEALEELAQAYKAKNKKEINKDQHKVRRLILERVSVVMQEHKRRLDLNNYIRVEQLIVALTGTFDMFREVAQELINDPAVVTQLTSEVAKRIYSKIPAAPSRTYPFTGRG
jgi:hypothetical protein